MPRLLAGMSFPSRAVQAAVLFAALAHVCLVSVEAAGDPTPTPDPKKLKSQADRLFRAEKFQESLSAYSQAIRLEPDARSYYNRHKVFLRLSKLNDAIADLTHSIALDDKFVMAYLQRGGLRLMHGNCADAVEDFATVLRLDSTKRDAQKRLPEAQQCKAAIETAEVAMKHGRFDVARDHFTDAMQPGRATQSVHLVLQRMRCYMKLDQLPEAVSEGAIALKMDSSNLEAYQLRGEALYMMGDFKMAMTHFREGIKMDPDHAGCKAWLNKVKSMLRFESDGDEAAQNGDHATAIAKYLEAQKVDPHHRLFVKGLLVKTGKSYLKLGNTSAALASCGQASSIDDNYQPAHLCSGEAYMAKESWDEAIRSYHRAKEIDANHEANEGLARAEAALKQSKLKDYYKILELPRNCDDRDIKRAYRKKALEWHPDKHQDTGDIEKAERMFQDIGEAYEVLSDPEKRSKYDRGEDVFPNQQGGQQQQHGFHGFPGNFHFKFNF